MKSAKGRRPRSPAKDTSRQCYNTPHPPGHKSIPTRTRFSPHRPVSAPAAKTQEHSRPAWQQVTPRSDYSASPAVIRELYDLVHTHEEKLSALSAEVKAIPRVDVDSIILRIERRSSEREAEIEDKLKTYHDQGKALSARIADMTMIIQMDEDKKRSLEGKIRELEGRLVRAGSSDEQLRESQLSEFTREKDALDRRLKEKEGELRAVKAELQNIHAEKSTLQRLVENEQRERERTERSMRDAVEAARELGEDLRRASSEKTALQTKIDSEKRERERLERLQKEEVESLEFDKKMLMEQLQSVQAHMELEKGKTLDLQKELDKQRRDLRDQLAQVESKFKQEKQTWDEEVYSLKREKENLMGENVELKRKLNKEIEDFGRRSDTIHAEKSRLQRELEDDLESTRRRNAQLEADKRRVEADKERAEAEHSRVSKEMEQLRQDMEFLKNQLASAEIKLANAHENSAPESALRPDKQSPEAHLGPLVFSPEQLRALSKELAQSFSADDSSPGPLVSAKKKNGPVPDYQHQYPTPYPHTKEERDKRLQSSAADRPVDSSVSDSTYQDYRHLDRPRESREKGTSKMSSDENSQSDKPEKGRYSRSLSQERSAQADKYYQKQHSRQLVKQKSLSEEVEVMDDIIREKKELVEKATAHKAAIKAGIKEWIATFTAEHGRPPAVEDKETVSDLYIAHQEVSSIVRMCVVSLILVLIFR